jgi:hypothetical protein
MEFIMFRRRLIFHTTLCLLVNSPWAVAATFSYKFDESAEPAFLYTSGNFPDSVMARLSGQVSVTIDENTGAADLRFVDVVVHSAHSDGFLPEFFRETSLLSSFGDFATAIPGQRITSTEYKFGPTLTPRSYMQEFTLTAEQDSYRLIGESLFYGYDGGEHYINALLTPIPEPSAVSMLSIAVVSVSCLRRCRKNLL